MADCSVYINPNRKRSTLYRGVTNDFVRRIEEHRSKELKGFSADYSLSILLYHEAYRDARAEIARGKQLKGWRREKKVKLIERLNPRWCDLAENLGQPEIVRGPSTPLRFAQDDGEEQAAGPEFF